MKMGLIPNLIDADAKLLAQCERTLTRDIQICHNRNSKLQQLGGRPVDNILMILPLTTNCRITTHHK